MPWAPYCGLVLAVMQRLGIVGGGQLALYLCEAAQALGAEVSILAEPGDAPALLLADRRFVAPLDLSLIHI